MWYQYLKACSIHEIPVGKRPSSPLTAKLTALLFTPRSNLQKFVYNFSISNASRNLAVPSVF